MTAPAAPTKLSSTVSTQVTLTWTPSSGDIWGYNIFRDGKYLGSTPLPPFVDKGLSPGTSYKYEVMAYDRQSNFSPAATLIVNAWGLVTPAPTPTPTATPSTKLLGVFMGDTAEAEIASFGTWLGRSVDVVTLFAGAPDWSYCDGSSSAGGSLAWLFANWTPSRRIALALPLLPNPSSYTLAAAARGDYDAHYQTAARLIAARDPGMIVRLGWEMNGDWFSWSACPDPSAYIAAFRRVGKILRAAAPAIKIDWCTAFGPQNCAADKAYPGDDVVDIIGMDTYEMKTWTAPGKTPEQRWSDLLNMRYGIAWHGQFAAAHNKPISYPEWGTDFDDGYFVKQMIGRIKTNNVAYHSYWNANSDAVVLSGFATNPTNAAAYRAEFAP